MTAPSAAYTSSVIALAALKLRERNMPSGIIGCSRAVLDDEERDARHDPDDQREHGASVVPHSISAVGEAAEEHRGQRRARHVEGAVARGPWSPGTHLSATTTVTAAIGALIRKIQRQLAYSTRPPPTNGPIAAAMLPSPDQAPIARPRSAAHEHAPR